MPPWLRNSTQPKHILQMFADHFGPRQTIPWETINQGLLQPNSDHIKSTIAARISSSSFVWVSARQLAATSLSKGISSTLNFHKSIGTDGTQLATSCTPSECRIDWANLTAISWSVPERGASEHSVCVYWSSNWKLSSKCCFRKTVENTRMVKFLLVCIFRKVYTVMLSSIFPGTILQKEG